MRIAQHLDELLLRPDLGPGHGAVGTHVPQGVLGRLAQPDQDGDSGRAGASDAGRAVNDQPVTTSKTSDQIVDEHLPRLERWSVQVVDREPDCTSMRVMLVQPCHVVGIPIVQFVAFGQAHDRVGADACQHAFRVGPDDVLAAQPQASLYGRQRNLVHAAVVRPGLAARGGHGS